jgi:hypothetical protein
MFAGNPFPVAVGELMIDFAHFASNGMHGPCVRVLHYFSDQLGIVADVPMPEGFAIVPTPSVMPLVSQVVQGFHVRFIAMLTICVSHFVRLFVNRFGCR